MIELASHLPVLIVALSVYLVLATVPASPVRVVAKVEPKVSVLARIGASLRSHLGLGGSDEVLDKHWGSTVAILPLVVVHPAVPVLGLLAIWGRYIAQQRRRRLDDEHIGWSGAPEGAMVMALAVRSGANVQEAIDVAGRRIPGRGGHAFRDVSRRLAMGVLLNDAIEELPARLGEAGEPISRVIRRCFTTGAELAPALERTAAELQAQQHQRQLEAARRLPVLLLFPLVSCTLPAFALLTVVPLLVTSVGQLAG